MEALEGSSRSNSHIRMMNLRPKEVDIGNNIFIHSVFTKIPIYRYSGEEIKHGPHCQRTYLVNRRKSDNRKTR